MKTLAEFIANNLKALIPLRTIFPYQRGVRFTFGHAGSELQEGMYWYAPFIQRIEIVDSAPQVINLPTQSVQTEAYLGNGDNTGGVPEVSIAISAAIEYEIISAKKYWTRVQEGENSLSNMAMGIIRRQVSSKIYEELTEDVEDLEDKVAEAISGRAIDWGIKVHNVYFTDLVKHRAIRLLSDTAPGLGE